MSFPRTVACITLTALLGLSASLSEARASDAQIKKPKAMRLCVSCHTLEKGQGSKIGPNLYGVYGSKAASNPGFTKYGDSMKAAASKGLTWNDANLDAYITNPIDFLKDKTGSKKVKTSMISRVRNDKDRKEIIEYLKTLKD